MGLKVVKPGRKKSDEDPNKFNSTYMKVMKIPKYWRMGFLLKHCEKIGMTGDILAAIDEKNQDNINAIFDFFCGVHGEAKLPRACIDKTICDMTFAQRMVQLRRATAAWVNKAVDMYGNVDWSHGCFVFGKQKGEMVISHCDDSNAQVWSYVIESVAALDFPCNRNDSFGSTVEYE